MTSRILLSLACLLTLDTAGAVRVIEQVERAIELTLAELNLPDEAGGTISFRECDTCGISTHRLTEGTLFTVDGQSVDAASFLQAATELRERADGAARSLATVYLDLDSGRVTRIQLRR